MRISKSWSAVCAAAFLAGFPTARAQDNPAQAAARAALMNKMSEMNVQPAPPTNQKMAPSVIVTPSGAVEAPPSPPTSKPMATATPPPVETQPVPAPTPLEMPPAPASANDTPAQAAARAALMTKMSELKARQAQPANPSLAPIVLAPSGAAAEPPIQPANATTASPPPVEKQSAPISTPAETPMVPADASDTPAQAAARAALINKLSELNARQTQPVHPALQTSAPMNAMTASPPPVTPMPTGTQTAPPVTAVPETTPPPAAVAPVQKTEPVAAPIPSAGNSGFFTPVPPPSNPGFQAGAPPATAAGPPPLSNQRWSNQPPAAKAPAASPLPPPANPNYPGKSLGFKPMVAPPPPVSPQKEAELQALLARYIVNEISPEEYQKERAAILAQP